MSISSSHCYIPFSSSFLPKVNLEYIKKDQNFCLNIQVQNAKKEGFDPKATFSLIHSKNFLDMYGCELQVLAHKPQQHFSLLVQSSNQTKLDEADKTEIAKKFARAAVYRQETVYKLLKSHCASDTKKKKVNGLMCQEHTIALTYRKQQVEIKNINGLQKYKVISEKDIDRKVVLWVDPSKKKDFRFIGSLVDILQNEVPELSKLRKVVKDIRGHLQDLGWPMKLEFNIKKNVYVTMNVKNIQVLPDASVAPALFTIPK